MRTLSKQALLALPKWLQTHLLPLLLTIRAAGLLLSVVSLWAFAEIAKEILEQETYTFDKEILLALRKLHAPILDKVMLGFTFIGEPVVLITLCLGLGLWLLSRGLRSQATVLVIASVGAVGLNLLLKEFFGRARPMLWERVVDVGQYSFPSGHAMISLVVLGMCGYLLAAQFPRRRSGIVALTVILVTGIGLSRLYLGVHWPTDVVAGYAAGLVWLVTCIFSLQLWQARSSVTQE